MASGALPPGLPPVMIEGEAYWDGGLVSNTPLQYILDYTGDDSDKCIFQLDLFSARGAMPQNLLEVAQREKEIRYSSRTRLNTDTFGGANHAPRRAAPARQAAAAGAARRGLRTCCSGSPATPPSPSCT